jgi:septal ring factor EnvC (AmiA/AmiB activator)
VSATEFDRILALEEEARLLRRDLERQLDERIRLVDRLALAEERLAQAESDVKDAHDRAKNVEDRVLDLEKRLGPIEPGHHTVDERELGEAGA